MWLWRKLSPNIDYSDSDAFEDVANDAVSWRRIYGWQLSYKCKLIAIDWQRRLNIDSVDQGHGVRRKANIKIANKKHFFDTGGDSAQSCQKHRTKWMKMVIFHHWFVIFSSNAWIACQAKILAQMLSHLFTLTNDSFWDNSSSNYSNTLAASTCLTTAFGLHFDSVVNAGLMGLNTCIQQTLIYFTEIICSTVKSDEPS